VKEPAGTSGWLFLISARRGADGGEVGHVVRGHAHLVGRCTHGLQRLQPFRRSHGVGDSHWSLRLRVFPLVLLDHKALDLAGKRTGDLVSREVAAINRSTN
jgi:hypothetical protein